MIICRHQHMTEPTIAPFFKAKESEPAPAQIAGVSSRSRLPAQRTRSPSLQRAGECAAVEQDVLSGDEAGLVAAQKRASLAEFLGVAETAGRIEFGPFRQHRVHGDAASFRFRLCDRAA